MKVLSAGFFFLCLNLSWAQTGPGGVGNASSNVLWLSADNAVFSDAGITPAANNGNVAQWNDRSGNGRNASHGTSGERPDYQTAVLNGLPVIRFTAASGDRLLSTNITTGNTASVFAVVSWLSLPSPNPGIIHAAPAGSAFSGTTNDKVIGMWVSNAGTNMVWGRGVQANNTQRDIPQNTATTVNTFYSFATIYDGSNINQYVNNTAAGTVTYNGTLKSWSDFGIGRQASESWNGDIAEIIAYNQAVNAAQRIIINNYLAAKYNLSLSSNDVYTMDNSGNGNFDHEVAGIGRVDGGNIHSDAQGSGMVRMFGPSGLGDNEFLMWGHSNGTLATVDRIDVSANTQARLVRVWRVSEVDAAGTAVDVGNIDIQFDLSDLVQPITASDLRLLIDHDGDGIFNETGTIEIGGAIAGCCDNYLFANVPGTSLTNGVRFTIGTINALQTPLPISLESFSGDVEDGDVVLQWTTASELNNDFFTVERSSNGKTFLRVGDEVKGAGTTQVRQHYAVVDSSAPYGKIYYRLKQTDFDGQSSFSSVIMLENKPGQLRLEPIPNPLSKGNELTLRVTSSEPIDFASAHISAFDMSGKRTEIKTMAGDSGQIVLRFNHDQASGIYVVFLRSPQLHAPLFTRVCVIR
jgi:hypothetical protein